MTQVTAGTVSITNASATVTGSGTTWLSTINVGDVFTVIGDGVWYEVAAVTSDGLVTLTAAYAGVTAAGVAYAITTSFTPVLSIPYPEQNDVETASLFRRAMLTVEAELLKDRYKNGIVKNDVLTAPPGGSGTGDAYVVAATATGAWVGKETNIAVFDRTGAWQFFVPIEGWKVYEQTSNVTLTFNGTTWV